MAADTRPYKSKEQDGQGNEVIIRDQQLVEQTSRTTMASDEYFEIVDVDGRIAKIPKDNMIGIVREALGTLLNSLTDQTTVAKFLTLNGNTLGASAAATAASVLGVTANTQLLYRGTVNGATNINRLINGVYYDSLTSDVFGGYQCFIINLCTGNVSTSVQLAIAFNTNSIAYRTGSEAWTIK